MQNFPGLVPQSSAWNALPEALSAGFQGYQQQKSLQMALAQKMMQQKLQSSEIDKNNAMAGLYEAKTPQGLDSSGNPILTVPSVGGQPSGTGQGGAFVLPEQKTITPTGMSSMDVSNMKKTMAINADKTTAQGKAGNQIPRGLATILSKSGLTMQESNRIDSLPSAINVHNQIIDAIGAYGNNDPSVAQATVNKYISQHPNVSPFFQSYKASPNNQAALYDALTRMGAIEQFKLQLGSQATPNEEAIKENQSMYPSLGEIAAKSPVVAQKLNALVDTIIRPAVEGPMNRISLMRDAQGNFPAPILGTIYNNLNSQFSGLEKKVKSLPGYSQAGDMMNIPSAQSGITTPPNGTRKPLESIFGK